MKLSEIDRVSCLLLDKRKYVIPYFKKVSKYYNIDIQLYGCGSGQDKEFKYDRVDTMQGKQYSDTSDLMECYRDMLKKARKDGCETILLFEDDCVFTNDANELLAKIDWPKKWHSLRIGGYTDRIWLEDGSINKEDTYEWFYDKDYDQPKWTKCYRPWGIVGCILNKESMDFCINGGPGTGMDHAVWNTLGSENPNRLEYIMSPNVIFERQLHDCTTSRRLFERMYKRGRILHFNEF